MKLTKQVLKNIQEMFISNDNKNVKLAKTLLINNDFDLEDFLAYFVIVFPRDVAYNNSIDISNKLKNSLLEMNKSASFAIYNFDYDIDKNPQDFIAICFKAFRHNRIHRYFQYISISKLNHMINTSDQIITIIEKNITDSIKSFKIKD